RLELAGEDEAIGLLAIEQRLLAEAIAPEQQRARLGVPQRDPEHAVEPREDAVAPRLVAVDDDLGVRVRVEAVPEPLELAAQLAVVVDLAVEDALHRLVFVVH